MVRASCCCSLATSSGPAPFLIYVKASISSPPAATAFVSPRLNPRRTIEKRRDSHPQGQQQQSDVGGKEKGTSGVAASTAPALRAGLSGLLKRLGSNPLSSSQKEVSTQGSVGKPRLQGDGVAQQCRDGVRTHCRDHHLFAFGCAPRVESVGAWTWSVPLHIALKLATLFIGHRRGGSVRFFGCTFLRDNFAKAACPILSSCSRSFIIKVNNTDVTPLELRHERRSMRLR